jgi:glutamyl-Q tRNA(Asp) synthetase
MQPVFRFAPSPNGFLHLGHAYSALLNGDLARRFRGRLLLRIEDIDPERSRVEFEQAIREDLAWLGLRFEDPVRRQSEHISAYRASAERLAAAGLLYPCACTRADIAAAIAGQGGTARDPDGAPVYPGTCLGRSTGEREAKLAPAPHAWRLAMASALRATGPLAYTAFGPDGAIRTVEAKPRAWGDVVIARKDVPASYHLAVVHDDALQGVTHVVRGADLDAATSIHRVLQTLLGLPAPRYHHHALLRDETGAKLAKRAGSPSLRALRRQGASPADIRRLVGLPPDEVT